MKCAAILGGNVNYQEASHAEKNLKVPRPPNKKQFTSLLGIGNPFAFRPSPWRNNRICWGFRTRDPLLDVGPHSHYCGLWILMALWEQYGNSAPGISIDFTKQFTISQLQKSNQESCVDFCAWVLGSGTTFGRVHLRQLKMPSLKNGSKRKTILLAFWGGWPVFRGVVLSFRQGICLKMVIGRKSFPLKLAL